ncbi:MAG: hypothetical protein ACHQ9S_23640 [Candidatus Binatia bacterium]
MVLISALPITMARPSFAEPFISATQINAYLTGKASPLAAGSSSGGVFVDNGLADDVDPRLIIGITGAETTFGTNGVCTQFFNAWDWFWCLGADTCKSTDSAMVKCQNSPFSSWADGIVTVTRRIRLNYLNKGYTSIPKIGSRYCGSGCENWVPTVTRVYRDDLGGDTSDLGFLQSAPAVGQLTLISGKGSIGDHDPFNQYTLDGGATFSPASIVYYPYSSDTIPGTQWINWNSSIYVGPFYGSSFYRTTFTLPGGFTSPTMSVLVHADNVATIYLNGVQVGQQTFAEIYPNFQGPPSSFAITDPALFNVGNNNLDFDIYNFTGPTAFDYEATITYQACPAAECQVADRDTSTAQCTTTNQPDGTPCQASPCSSLDTCLGGCVRGVCTPGCNFSSAPGEPERCFGGIGPRCEGVPLFAPFIQDQETCLVYGWMSVGSILHDKCCLGSNNAGYSCITLNQGDERLCKKEWDEAWYNTQCTAIGAIRQWPYTFGPYPAGNTGDATSKDLRAPSGAAVNLEYAYLCSSGYCKADAQGGTILKFDACGFYCECQEPVSLE